VPLFSLLRLQLDTGEVQLSWPGNSGKPLAITLPLSLTYSRVACGIMIGFVINFVIAAATNTLDGQPNAGLNEHGGRYHALQWIAAAPVVPSLLLFIAVCFCYESPRFYMRPGTPNYNLDRAFRNLLSVRPTGVRSAYFMMPQLSLTGFLASSHSRLFPDLVVYSR
jgi:hypothetical protein